MEDIHIQIPTPIGGERKIYFIPNEQACSNSSMDLSKQKLILIRVTCQLGYTAI